MSSDKEEHSLLQDEDSEDDFDWEEVDVPEHEPQHLEITLQTHPKPSTSSKNKAKGVSHAERLIRIDCHKIHTVALIANARVRNKWINEPLLHARLLSLTPLNLQTAFGAIHKSRVPDQNQRGRMFERAVEALAIWWSTTFFEVIPEGHIRNYTFDEIQKRLEMRGLHVPNVNDPDAILDIDTLYDIIGDEVETIRSEKSLMKHALMASGSRDTSAQLFTALCRALGIPARLVVSIQSVPWQASVGKPKPKYERKPKGKGKEVDRDQEPVVGPSHWDEMNSGKRLDGEAPAPKSERAKSKQKAKPVVKLRKQKPKGNILGAPRKLASPDPLTTPPVYWTEVFSRPDSKWIPVDPIRGLVNKRKSFDPTPSTMSTNPAPQLSYLNPPGFGPAINNNRRPPATKVENRMVYVLAFEEDGFAKDVTRRYAKEYGAKVAKVQGGSSAPNVGGGGKGRQAWWARVLNYIGRPYQLHRDDLEDQELEVLQMKEGMPTTVGGFKDHPLYVLTRHLKQTETIHPPPPATPELGKFRGEPVYPRSSVVSLKTSENWMRNMGRMVRAGEQPMKMVKFRAGTVSRMRELEVLKDELKVAGDDESTEKTPNSGPEVMQGLYAYSQTDPYIPEPVVDGKVPKNSFGNIDLYVPSMLPKGGSHIPFKGVAKIARKLGFDYAEAVTGFEFKKRRAFPIIEGIVVAEENEGTILEAFWEAEREAEEKARIKREDRVMKQWTRLIHGLRIRQRLQDQYATKNKAAANERSWPTSAAPNEENKGHAQDTPDDARNQDEPSDSVGGFLAGADKVVQAFHLPKNTHVVLDSPLPSIFHQQSRHRGPELNSGTAAVVDGADDEDDSDEVSDAPPLELYTYDLEPMDVDMEVDSETRAQDLTSVFPATLRDAYDHVPKTMQQMAEEAASVREQRSEVAGDDDSAAKEGDREVMTETSKPKPKPKPKLTPTTVSAARTTTRSPSITAQAQASTSNFQPESNPITTSAPISSPQVAVSIPGRSGLRISLRSRATGGITATAAVDDDSQRAVAAAASASVPVLATSKRTRGAAGGAGKAGKRGRKRARKGSVSEKSDAECLPDEDEDDEVDLGEAPPRRGTKKPTPSPSKSKRARTTQHQAPVETSTRTLRPRAAKSAKTLEEERRVEEAFRKAVKR